MKIQDHIIKCSQAMFGCEKYLSECGDEKNLNECSQMHRNQLKFMKEKCEGKEFCSARACDSWWGTNINCPFDDQAVFGNKPVMWLQFHCNSIPGGGMLTRKNGSCDGGT